MATASDPHDTPVETRSASARTAAGDDARRTFDAGSEPGPPKEPEEPVCANCGGAIGPDDLVCPHCGISLVSG